MVVLGYKNAEMISTTGEIIKYKQLYVIIDSIAIAIKPIYKNDKSIIKGLICAGVIKEII